MTTVDSMQSTLNNLANSASLQAMQGEYDKVKLAQFASEVYSNMKGARSEQDAIWYLNLAFYRGNQYMELVPRYNRLTVPKAPPYRVRHVSNRIKPIIRTEFARLTSQKPYASVVPSSSDDEDMFAAYAAEQIWESLTNRGKLRKKFGSAIWWTLLTGNGFLKTWWDNNSYDTDSGVEGDICFGAVTPFHLFVPDLMEEDIQNQPYVMNVYTKPLQWVKKFYGPYLDGVNIVPDQVSENEIMNNAYLGVNTSGTDQKNDAVLCMELWMKDGATDLVEGNKVVHVLGGQVVSVADMYSHGEYPFTHFGHIPSGKFYRTSVIEDLVTLQREYNRTRSQIIENKNRMARLQLLAPKGSVEPHKITNEPGLVIEYRPGLPPPQPMPLQPVPNYVIQELDRTIQDMEDISGQHEVSRGNVPPGVTAATAISYLQEKDDSQLSHTFTNVEEGWESIGRQALNLVQQYWDVPHTIKVVGEQGFFDVIEFTGADLKNNVDIRMEGGSALPTSKAAKQSLLMDMMKMGFISPEQGLEMMDIGGIQKIYERIRRDQSQAQRENIRLKNVGPDMIEQFKQQWEADQMQEMDIVSQLQPGQQPPTPLKTIDPQTQDLLQTPPFVPVNTWDNHDVHIEVHNNYRKSQAFELLDDAVKEQFEMHVQSHVMAVSQAMMEAQQFQMGGMMGGGAPGEEPPPGQEPPPGEEPPPEQSGPPQMPGGM